MGRGATDSKPKPNSKSGNKRQAKQQALKSAFAAASWVVNESMVFCDPDSPFRADIAKGDNKLVLVTGENASGKSLFVRVTAAALHKEGKLPVSISIRERTGAGLDGDGGMRRVMMFGDEQEQSTGATSVSVLERAFKNLDRPKGSILIVDEPELGLSDGYAEALGRYIAERIEGIPKKCLGVMVITHSRALTRGLIEGRKVPTHVAVAADGTPKAGIQDWIDAQAEERRSVKELLELRETGLQRWRTVNALLK